MTDNFAGTFWLVLDCFGYEQFSVGKGRFQVKLEVIDLFLYFFAELFFVEG